MWKWHFWKISVALAVVASVVGCSNLPGDRGSQGAVIGGVTGAAVGAAVGGEKHRILGAILGGALGAGGGYVIGAQTEKLKKNDSAGAQEAIQKAQSQPATAQDALNATTADLNNDGFVTLDEVVAMHQAGFSDDKMLERLRASDQIFELTAEQRQYLLDRGVSRSVVDQMNQINQDKQKQLLKERRDIISQPTPK